MSDWRWVSTLCKWLVICLCLALPHAAAEANDKTAAALDLYPTSVDGRTISSNAPAFFFVRVKAGSLPLTDIRLSVFSNDGVAAAVDGTPSSGSLTSLAADAEHAWKVKVTPVKGVVVAPGALSVHVTVAFQEGKDPVLQRYLFKELKITAPVAPTVPALAEIDFKGTLNALSHERPGQLFVTLTNKHSQTLEVASIEVSTPQFIKATPDKATVTLPYGETKVVRVDIKVEEQIVPGKYPIVVTAAVAAPDGLSSTVVKSQDVEINVLGESDILLKLGVPSLLFLPGVLFLLTWQLLWSFGKTAEQRQAYSMTATNTTFWVIAVALSIGAALAYPKIVFTILKDKRDFLVAYGLIDYMYVFGIAIGGATILFVVWLTAKAAVARWKAFMASQHLPTIDDRPEVIVTKLGRLKRSIVLPRARAAGGPAAELVFVLEPWRDSTSIWIAPPAEMADGPNATAGSRNLMQDIVDGRQSDARSLAPILKEGRNQGWWTIEWQPVGPTIGPRKVLQANWSQLAADRLIVGP